MLKKKITLVICNLLLSLVLLSDKSMAYPILLDQIKSGQVNISTINETLICENGCEEKDKKWWALGGAAVILVGVVVLSKKCDTCCIVPNIPVLPPPVIYPPVVVPPTSPPSTPTPPNRRNPPSRTEVPEPATGLLLLLGGGLIKGYRICKRNMRSEIS